MTSKRIPLEAEESDSIGKDDGLERYLAQTIDLRNETALVIEGHGSWPVFKTLDGTRVFLLGQLSEMTGRDIEELTTLVSTRRIQGVCVGDMWFTTKEEAENRR